MWKWLVMVESRQAGWWVWLQWVFANAVGTTAGLTLLWAAVQVGGEILDTADIVAPRIAAGGAVGGALYGIITGGALLWLLRNRLPESR
jgi:hypothetical protein